jgi:hypothetical protein
MQLISKQILYVTHNTLASINYKRTRVSRFHMHQGLPCSKETLEYAMLHEVVPQAPLWQHPSLAEEAPMMMFPTCDDDFINEFK